MDRSMTRLRMSHAFLTPSFFDFDILLAIRKSETVTNRRISSDSPLVLK